MNYSPRTNSSIPSRSPTGYVPPPLNWKLHLDRSADQFKVADQVVHPAHGVGEIVSIEERELGGIKGSFYKINILDTHMKILVPVDAAAQVGLRDIMSPEQAEEILETMRSSEVAVNVQPWNRRFRIYTEMLQSKSPYETAKVLRDMNRLKSDKSLSFGERKLLNQAKSLLIKELSLAKKMSDVDIESQIDQISCRASSPLS